MAFELKADDFAAAMSRSIQKEVERVLAEEAELAAKRCNERVRREVGAIATSLLSEYRVYMQGRDELHIVVRVEGLEKGGAGR